MMMIIIIIIIVIIFFFYFSSLQGLQIQPHRSPTTRGSVQPRNRSEETLADGSTDPKHVGLQTRLPGVCSLIMPHQINSLFFIAKPSDPKERVCSQAPRVSSLIMPYQIMQFTVKSVYNNSYYNTKQCNSQ